MVPDLVRDDIGLRELARGAEAPGQLVVEPEVDIDLPVARAVEGTRCALGEAARGLDGVAEEDQVGVAVLPAHLREDLGPGPLGVVQDERDELLPLFFLRVVRARRAGDARTGASDRAW